MKFYRTQRKDNYMTELELKGCKKATMTMGDLLPTIYFRSSTEIVVHLPDLEALGAVDGHSVAKTQSIL